MEQDGRWGKAEEKLLNEMAKQGKFAGILDTKVNLKKVNVDVMSKWITKKIIHIVKMEDDILINMVINLLQTPEVDGKRMQISLTPFLDKNTGKFMEELWTLLVDAQGQSSGIPSVFIEKKKQEILARDAATKPATPTKAVRSGSPPGPGRLSAVKPSTSPPSIRSVIREDDKKRAESRARVHKPRESAPEQHHEDDGERQRARSRRHGLEERSASTKKRHRDEEESDREQSQSRDQDKPRQRYPSRHHDRRDRGEAKPRRSPPRDI